MAAQSRNTDPRFSILQLLILVISTKGRSRREGRTKFEIALGAIQQQGLLQPRIFRICIQALRIKLQRLLVRLSFEIIVTLFLEVLRDVFSFLMRFRVSAASVV